MLPADYFQSRQVFRDLARSLDAEAQRFPHGSQESSELSTEVVYLGPSDARTLLVISSGTHGVEGYAGAACQFRFMQTYRERHSRNGIGYLLVHAVNPWGYRHDRRVTREGVDLNRNFVDFPVAPGAFRGYDDYHDLLVSNYRPLPAGLWNELRLFGGALSATRRKAMQAAITAGQYRHQDGLFFGGSAPTQSRAVWESILENHVHHKTCTFLLDIHTGLGKRGAGELISYLPAASEDFQRMSQWFDGDIRSMASGESVSAAVAGTLTEAFDRMASSQSYAIGLEFGTSAPLAVLNAMRADQWRHNNAHRLTEKQREWARRKMKNAFAPDDPEWHDQVLVRFDQVMDKLNNALAGRSSAA